MIPPDWMLKSDTITTQDERVRQAQKAYERALARIKEDPENQSRRDDLEKAAKFLHDEVKQSWWDKRGRLLRREEFEGEMSQFIDPAALSLEECEAIWQKSLTQDLAEEEWGRLVTFRGPEEVLANEMVQQFQNIGVERPSEETKLGKTNAGRKEEFIQWKGTHEELVLLLEILKDTGLIHYEQFPLTKICGLFVDNQFQNLKRSSVKRKNYVVKANRDELKEKKLRLINKINRIAN